MNSKERRALISTILILCISIMTILLPMECEASSAGVKTLKPDKTYKSFDITGDGKKDSFKIVRCKKYGEGAYSKVKILVNGKKAYEIGKTAYYRQTYYPNFIYRTTRAKLITFRNGKKFLFLYCPYEEGGGMFCSILKYKNGKFKKVVDLINYIDIYGEYCSGSILGVSGNTVRVKLAYASYTLGRSDYEMSFKYSGGTLKQDVSKGKLLRAYTRRGKTRRFAVGKTINVYKKPSGGRVYFKLYSGDRVTVDQCRITPTRLMLKVKCGNKVGWMHAVTRYEDCPFTNAEILDWYP